MNTQHQVGAITLISTTRLITGAAAAAMLQSPAKHEGARAWMSTASGKVPEAEVSILNQKLPAYDMNCLLKVGEVGMDSRGHFVQHVAATTGSMFPFT